MTRSEEAVNPMRECKICGVKGNSCERIDKYGNRKYTPLCKTCFSKKCNKNYKDKSKKLYSICAGCGDEKSPSMNKLCYTCTILKKDPTHFIIKGNDLIEIKYWMRKQEIREWMTDLAGISELIEMYSMISSLDDYTSFFTGTQLKKMWLKLLKLYDIIKVIDNDILIYCNIDKGTIQFKNKAEIEKMMTKKKINKNLTSINKDLTFFF